MINNFHAVALVALISTCAQQAQAPHAFQVARELRSHLLATWFEQTPSSIAEMFQFPLTVVADGDGPLLRAKGESSDVMFGFVREGSASPKLNTLTVIERGPKDALLTVAKTLAEAAQVDLPPDALAELISGETIDLSKRTPEDPRVSGVLTVVTISLRSEGTWVLDFHLSHARD